MVQNVKLPNGEIIPFPDNATIEQIQASVNNFMATESATAPQGLQEGGGAPQVRQGAAPQNGQQATADFNLGSLTLSPTPENIPAEVPPETEPPAVTPQQGEIPLGELDGDGKIPQEKSFLDQISDVAEGFKQASRSAASTATFGISDLVAGGGSALAEQLFGSGEEGAVAEAFKEPSQEKRKFQEENPITALAASVAGGFINPLGQKFDKIIGQAPTRLKSLAANVGLGSILGTLQTGGDELTRNVGKLAADEEVKIGEIFENLRTGALVGGAGGALASAAAPILRNIASFFGKGRNRRLGIKGLTKVTQSLEREGLTLDEALKKVDDLGPEAALIDTGINPRGLGGAVFNKPGKGQAKLGKFVAERQRGFLDPQTKTLSGSQFNRINEHLDSVIPETKLVEALRLKEINDAAKFYKRAYSAPGNQNIDTPAIKRLLDSPDGKLAQKRATRTIQNLKAADKIPENEANKGSLRYFDQVKRALFKIEDGQKTNQGLPTPESKSVTDVRKAFVNELDRVDLINSGGSYGKARGIAEDTFTKQEVLEKGADFMSKREFRTPQDLETYLEDLSPAQKHLFRIGFASEVKNKIGDIPRTADITKKLINFPNTMEKIRLAFGDEELFVKFMQDLEDESTLFLAVSDVLGNSTTAKKIMALDDAAASPSEILDGIKQVAGGSPIRGGVQIAKGLANKFKFSEQEAEVIADALISKDRDTVLRALSDPEAFFNTQANRRAFESAITSAVASGQATDVNARDVSRSIGNTLRNLLN